MKEQDEIQEAFKHIDKALGIIPLNEMSMAWVDKNAGKCVWVENPNTHVNKYFKYYNSFSYHKANAVARISLKEPKYLEHKNLDGKQDWKLTNKEKKELVKLMQSQSKVHKGYTNWQVTLIQYNFDNFFIQPEETINGTFDRQEFPQAFDINYPMPDYTQL